MAASQVRIRVDFSDLIFENEEISIPKICWMLVNQNSTPDIWLLKRAIKERFLKDNETQFDLYLLGALLPDFESIFVIRDEDLVRLIPVSKSKKRKLPEHTNLTNGLRCLESPSIINKQADGGSETQSPKKKLKRKSSKGLLLCTDNADAISHPSEVLENKEQNGNANADDFNPTFAQPQIDTSNEKTVEKCETIDDADKVTEGEELLINSKTAQGRKKKRIRKRKKHSPAVTADSDVSTISQNPTICSEPRFHSETLNISESAKKHIHFSDDGDEVTENTVDKNASSSPCKLNAPSSFQLKPTQLPPTNVSFDKVCNELLQRAKTESQENPSVILINCADSQKTSCAAEEPTVTRSEADYENLPPLRGPPSTGDLIAYKVLELSDKFIPELSSYKEALVKDIDSSNETITLEIKVGKVQRVLKGQSGGYDTVVLEDVKNVADSTEKIVKVQQSHMHDIKIISSRE